MMDRFKFDSVLFPFNLVCYARGNFGPAAIPPGDISLFRLAMNLAAEFQPLAAEERTEILAETRGMVPLFHS
jgi:hypothetical protein